MKEELRVLMVEDMPADAELVKRAVKKHGFTFTDIVVEREEDYVKAINKFKPDIILSDFSLPQFNGMMALMIREELAPSTPFIIVTGSNNEIIAVECMKAGADDYIIKEHLARLGPAIDSAILKHKLMQSEKESNDALRISEERYRNFLSQVTEGVYRFELTSPMPISLSIDEQIWFIYHNTYLAESNSAFLKMYCVDKFDDLINKRFLDFHGGENNPVNRAAVKQLIESNYKIESVVTAEINAEGEVRYFSNNSIGIIENGNLIRIWGTQRDITESINAEKLLRQSEEEYRKLFQNAHDAILILDPDNEIILETNNRALDIYGFTREEFIGMSLRDISHDPKSGDEKVKQALKTGHIGNFETIQYRKDGKEIIFEINASIISYKGKKAILSMNHDITERKIIEETLRESEEKMRVLVEGTPHFFFYTQDAEGNITYVSPSVETITGHKVEDWFGQGHWFTTESEINNEARRRTLANLKGEHSEDPVFVEVQNANGSKILLQVYEHPVFRGGNVVGLQGIAHDITEKRRAEEAVKESEEKYRLLAENMVDMVAQHNTDGTYTYISPSMTRLLGYEIEELIGTNPYLLFHPEDIERIKSESHDFALKGEVVNSIEYRIKKKDGGYIWFNTATKPIKNMVGEIVSLQTSSHDITDRKIAEEELLKQKTFFEQMFSQSSISTQILDKDGWCERINPKLSEIFGVKPEHIEGKVYNIFKDQGIIDGGVLPHLEKVFMKGETAEWEVHFDIGAAAESQNIEVKEKKKVWYSNWAYPILNEDGELSNVIIQHTDISERKNAEIALRNSEASVRTLLQTIPDLIWLKDTDGVYLSCNKMFERFFGACEADIVGKTDYDFVNKELADFFRENDQNAIFAGKSTNNEEWVTFADNGHRVLLDTIKTPMFDAVGKIVGVLGIGRDITERKQAEEALKESEERFRKAFQISPDSVNINRLEDGLYINVNDGFTMLTGYTRSDVEGKTTSDINIWVNPADREKLVDGLRNNGMVNNLESQFRRKDGSITTALMSASIFTLNGVPHILSITRDIQEFKNAQNALKESEIKYRSLYNNVPVGVFKSTPEGEILSLNQKMFQIYGYDDPAEFVKRPAESFYSDPFERKHIVELIKKERAVDNYVTEETKKDGTGIWIKCNYVGEFNDRGELIGIEGVVEDITVQKEAEEALCESEEKFRLLAENSTDVIWTMNEKGDYMYISPSVERLRGYTPEEAIEQGIKGAMDKKTASKIKREISEAVKRIKRGEKPESTTLILELLCKNGGSVWTEITTSAVFDNEGKFVSFLGVTRDITKRKKAEEALRESEERFRHSFDYAANCICIVGIDGKFQKVNSAFEKLFGYTNEEIKNYHFNDITHLDDVFIGSTRVKQLLDGDIGNAEFEKRYLTKYQKVVWGHVSTSLVKDDHNLPLFFITQIIDVTERIHAERKIELYQNHLEELVNSRTKEIDQINIQLKNEIAKEKEVEGLLREALSKEQELNELKTQFISTVSHEFRTPLTTILSSIELLQRYGRKWEESKYLGHTEKVITSIDRLTSLMDNVLLISRTDSGKIEFEPVKTNLDEFCKGIINELSPLLLPAHKLIYNYDADVKEFDLDEKLLRLIIMNLLSNSIKYSPNGGAVTLNVSKTDKLCLAVSDEGIGIDESDLSKVFDSFYRADDAYEFSGTGLGLTIVKRSVDLHKGKISVESEKGKGSRFKVEIPLTN